ncbi:hypothetical protein AHiyo8_02370 [Arthrobacter sp. Hiyo8]|nr:hypothetical protein AHiyo8_02370 [Arthrobacter sp. Hiyo8]
MIALDVLAIAINGAQVLYREISAKPNRVSCLEPNLWTDWCAVTNTAQECRDDAVLTRFKKQAGASQRLISQLRSPRTNHESRATAWPAAHHEESDALERLLRLGSILANSRQTFWIERLRLRRMMFAAVLLAPACQGGLGLTRDRASISPRTSSKSCAPRSEPQKRKPAALHVLSGRGSRCSAQTQLGHPPWSVRSRNGARSPQRTARRIVTCVTTRILTGATGRTARICCRASTAGATSINTARCTGHRCLQ